jgi:hypothetical protein
MLQVEFVSFDDFWPGPRYDSPMMDYPSINQDMDFPKDFFVPINGEFSREGRLCVNKLDNGYCVEVDVVFIESKKIWFHVGAWYGLEDLHAAIEMGNRKLSFFLQNKNHSS